MTGVSITAFVSAKLSFIFLYIDLVPYCIWDCNIPIGLFFAEFPNRIIYYLMFFIFFKKFSCKTFLQPIFAQKMVLPFCYEDFHITIQHVHNFIYVAYHHYGSKYEKETASPGYYSLQLTKYNIKVEATSTLRTGLTRFTFPKGKSHILMNLGEGLTNESGAYLRRINNREIEGMKFLGTFCYNPQAVFPIYFVMRINKAGRILKHRRFEPAHIANDLPCLGLLFSHLARHVAHQFESNYRYVHNVRLEPRYIQDGAVPLDPFESDGWFAASNSPYRVQLALFLPLYPKLGVSTKVG
jgi:hypothetical protein